MVSVCNLRVDYDDVCAVNDLSLDIGAGQVFGLIGPNGAGKTTTLRALVGLVEPTYGDILINGIDVDHNREEATRLIGFMPDSAPIYDDLSVWEYLDLFAASYMLPAHRRDAAIGYSLQLVDLTEKRKAMTGQLSRGMKQRLMLAKTLLPDPQVLLLDEPASGVDPFGRALLKDIMRGLGAAGKTVIISSHILSELAEFCTSIGIMERGRMVVSGSVADVTRQVFGVGEITIKVLSDLQAAADIIAADPRTGPPRREDNGISFRFNGEAVDAAELLTTLVEAGVKVAAFMPQQEDLESVFLKVGAREVS